MSGTRKGGMKTAVKNWEKDPDHYRKIGAMGGKAKGPDYQKGGKKASGFAANPELARIAGAQGGRISRRSGPSKKDHVNALKAYELKYGETVAQLEYGG